MTRSYVLWGAFGGPNLGDEAILWAMSKFIEKSHPSAKRYVLIRGKLADDVALQYQAWGLTPVRLTSFHSLSVLRRARLVGGGGNILYGKSFGFPIGWTSLLVLLNRIFGHRPLILCIGATLPGRFVMRKIAKYFYSLAEACTFRDLESLNVARAIGIREDRISLTKDVVFSADRSQFPRWQPGNGIAQRIAILVVRDFLTSDGNAEYVSELARRLLDAGYEVSLVPHDLRMDYDMGLLLKLEKEFMNEPRIAICKPQFFPDVLNIYANVDAVVSSRMHPLILASLMETLPIAIPDSAKVRSLVGALAIPALPPNQSRDQHVLQIRDHLAGRQAFLQAISSHVAEFKTIVEEGMENLLKD